MSRFSDYIVYVDESGTRDLDNIDAGNPLFIQSFCIFDKKHCSKVVAPQIQQLKFKHFGHDAVALDADSFHRQQGAFETLSGSNQRQQFVNELNTILESSNYILISCIVDKQKFNKQAVDKQEADKQEVEKNPTQNPFDAALSFGLDNTYRFLQEREQVDALSHIIFKKQSPNEDDVLQLLFRNFCDQNTANKQTLPFELQWAEQNSKPSALQLTSFMTQAVADRFLQPEQNHPAFDILKSKFYCKGGRKSVGEGYEGWGLKVFSSLS